MLSAIVRLVGAIISRVVERVAHSVRDGTRPAPLAVGLLRDLPRSREQLIAENALLRQQLIVAARSAKRPRLATRDRVFLVLLARVVPRWRDAILLVKPETVLRWHREGLTFLLQSPKTPREGDGVLDGDVCTRDYDALHEEANDPLTALEVEVLQPGTERGSEGHQILAQCVHAAPIQVRRGQLFDADAGSVSRSFKPFASGLELRNAHGARLVSVEQPINLTARLAFCVLGARTVLDSLCRPRATRAPRVQFLGQHIGALNP